MLNYVEGVVRAVANYGGYPYTPPTGTATNYYTVQRGDSLWSIARQFGITVQELRDLNNLTNDFLQIGQILKISAQEAPPQTENTTYTVQKGDSLWSIARDFGISVQELRTYNNLTSDLLQIGQILQIPTSMKVPEMTQTYVVQRGDSLWTIAQAFNTTVSELRRLNNLTSDLLQIGQTLQVPQSTNTDTDTEIEDEDSVVPPASSTTYQVKSGDSLWSIARLFKITVEDIKAANNLTSNLLQIGQILTIPTTSTGSKPITYTVQPGDSLWEIARTYGTTVNAIRELNQLTSNVLQIGQILLLPPTESF